MDQSNFVKDYLKEFSDIARPIKIPHYRVQDIDTKDDWIRAELMFEAMNFNNKK